MNRKKVEKQQGKTTEDTISNWDNLKTFIRKELLKPKFQSNVKILAAKNPLDNTKPALKILDWLIITHKEQWAIYDITIGKPVFTGSLQVILAQLDSLIHMNCMQVLINYQLSETTHGK